MTATITNPRPWAADPDLEIGQCEHCSRWVLRDPDSGTQTHADGNPTCEQDR